MNELEKLLRETIEGEVYFDQVTNHVYSVDASIFEIVPTCVVIPKNHDDLKSIVEIAHRFKMPITPRGAATGITGGCLGRGIIVDLSKYFNDIFEINIDQKYVICQPGVILDDLNKRLEPFGFRLGPDTSTGNRATLGGMLANNAAGARSIRYGKMVDDVQSVKLLVSTGQILEFSEISKEEWEDKCTLNTTEGKIYQILKKIKTIHAKEIEKHFPKIPRRVSGYNLDELLKGENINVAKLIAGSEGTLGIVTEIRMKIVSLPRSTNLFILFFKDILDAFKYVPALLEYHPLSIELIDQKIIELGRNLPSIRPHLQWLHENPAALLIIEVESENIIKMEQLVKNQNYKIISDPKEMKHVWELRKGGLGILLSKRGYSRAVAFLEDISVSPHLLASFMEKFIHYLQKHGKEAGIYGHAGSGCMHLRPYLDLRDPQDIAFMKQMMEDISSLLLEYQGALSGEHGDGLIRSWLNPKMYGPRIMELFKEVKKTFDPHNLFNPGKIIPLSPKWEELRTVQNEHLQSISTFLDFKPEGGFELAADLCNGNGLCRKKENIMCPSFQATNEEFHSTRARAQALRSIIHKRLPLEEFTGHGLHDVMDLCLSCKGCKTECPSQVDMAKFKSEFLYHYQQKHGISIRTKLFAHIGTLNAWLSLFSSFFNSLSRSRFAKKILNKIGITSTRPLPSLAKQRFSHWYNSYLQPENLKKAVILLNDTFTEFNHPEIGQATVKILNQLGYYVQLPPWKCCGRPALTKGLLPLAHQQASLLLDQLYAYGDIPLIGLEPSCLFTLRDDYLSLIQEKKSVLTHLLSRTFILDEFLAQLIDQQLFNLPFNSLSKKAKVHGHCYQKALIGMSSTLKVLKAVPHLQFEEIHSGCCGMAGSFGYEKEHESLSLKIGELHLFPAVRNSSPETIVIANGMSCRDQIKQGTTISSLHLSEALLSFLVK